MGELLSREQAAVDAKLSAKSAVFELSRESVAVAKDELSDFRLVKQKGHSSEELAQVRCFYQHLMSKTKTRNITQFFFVHITKSCKILAFCYVANTVILVSYKSYIDRIEKCKRNDDSVNWFF